MPDPVSAPQAAEPLSGAERGLGIGLLLALTVLLCLWSAFLVPLRIGTVRLPVSLLVAGVGNALLGRAGARLLGVPGIVVPAALWMGLAFLLGTRRTEGDLVVPGDVVGTLFLAVGALGFAVAYAMRSLWQVPALPGGAASR